MPQACTNYTYFSSLRILRFYATSVHKLYLLLVTQNNAVPRYRRAQSTGYILPLPGSEATLNKDPVCRYTTASKCSSDELGTHGLATVNGRFDSSEWGHHYHSSLTGIACLVGYTCLTPSCLRRGTGGDRNNRRWGKRETVLTATLSPLE